MTPIQVERFIRNLGAQKILQQIKRILFSKLGGHLIDPRDFEKYDRCILKILKEFDREDLPVITNMDFGHTDPMMILPYGRIRRIDV
ncbi:MAG: hypothetical protein A3F42_05825 [Gammaproteobacteria bacterium RIFCSPHIGHO2_12_FULL_37_34]|nr:MAG: hypothetical protein A3F42_05825 [Gammaproteobacteria bacterium RIFCSPHIGHO2_12_FULL_37_34]